VKATTKRTREHEQVPDDASAPSGSKLQSPSIRSSIVLRSRRCSAGRWGRFRGIIGRLLAWKSDANEREKAHMRDGITVGSVTLSEHVRGAIVAAKIGRLNER
jgi:hypothetical protein